MITTAASATVAIAAASMTFSAFIVAKYDPEVTMLIMLSTEPATFIQYIGAKLPLVAHIGFLAVGFYIIFNDFIMKSFGLIAYEIHFNEFEPGPMGSRKNHVLGMQVVTHLNVVLIVGGGALVYWAILLMIRQQVPAIHVVLQILLYGAAGVLMAYGTHQRRASDYMQYLSQNAEVDKENAEPEAKRKAEAMEAAFKQAKKNQTKWSISEMARSMPIVLSFSVAISLIYAGEYWAPHEIIETTSGQRVAQLITERSNKLITFVPSTGEIWQISESEVVDRTICHAGPPPTGRNIPLPTCPSDAS